MGRRIYVGNLSWDTTEEVIREVFADFGEVRYAKVVTDRETGKSRGFGFVEMGTDAEAAHAISAMHGQPLDGRSLTVNEAKEREDRGGGGGGPRNADRGGGGGPRHDDRNNDRRGGGRQQYDRRLPRLPRRRGLAEEAEPLF